MNISATFALDATTVVVARLFIVHLPHCLLLELGHGAVKYDFLKMKGLLMFQMWGTCQTDW